MCSVFAFSAAAQKKILQVVLQDTLETYDPIYFQSIAEGYLGNNLFETLVARDPKTGVLVPRAAKSFAVSPDGLKITFNLRSDLRWSDGKKITATDFQYSITRILDPINQSPHREKLMAILGAEELSSGGISNSNLGIAVESPLKLRIDLKRPSSSIMNVFTQAWMGVVSKSVVDRYLKKWTDIDHWVGSGVFIPSAVTATSVKLVKNPFHRFKSILKIDEVLVRKVRTREEGLRLYMNGQAHIFGHRDFDLPEESRVRLSSLPDLVYQQDFLCTILRLNTSKIPFSNEKLRQALAMAVDRDLIIGGLGSKGEKVSYSIIPEKIQLYDPPNSFLYAPQRAKKMLASLGYCTREGEVGCSELPLVEILLFSNEKYRKIALAISVMLKQNLGWKNVSIKDLSQTEFVGKVGLAEYTLALDEVAVLPEHPFGFLDAFRKDRSSSGGFSHREYERILDAAELTTQWDDAKSLYRSAEGILMQEGGVIPLYHGATYLMVSPKVHGFTPNIWDDHPFSQILIDP